MVAAGILILWVLTQQVILFLLVVREVADDGPRAFEIESGPIALPLLKFAGTCTLMIVCMGVGVGASAWKGHWISSDRLFPWILLYPLAPLPILCFGWAITLVGLAVMYDLPRQQIWALGLVGIGFAQVILLNAGHRFILRTIRRNTESFGYCFGCGYNVAISKSSRSPECGAMRLHHAAS